MWTAATVVMYVALLAAHEMSHALALRQYGIPISEAGLGLPFAPRLLLKPTPRRPFALSISIWLFAAYVTPDEAHEKRLMALPYRDKAWFYGAGVVANAVIGTGLIATILAVQGSWLRALLWAAVTAALWIGRRWFVAYAVPILALPLMALFAWSLVASAGEPAGFVGMATVLAVPSGLVAIKTVAVVSLALAMLNMLPFYPFDGGRICGEVVHRWGGERGKDVFEIAGISLVLGLFAYSMISDVVWLLFS
jgi:membrane-associated protease RseP (regulator of RpoE activity)